jgi:FAD/FMN-containing dehydrogenase
MRLASWGGHHTTEALVARPSRYEDTAVLFEWARRDGMQVALRGAGNSYGDAAMSEQVVLDLSRMDSILDWDADTGVLEAEPGVTVEAVWRFALPRGYWLPVSPGTMRPTLGGCVGMNVHGKNAWREGPLGDHLLDFDLLTPTEHHRGVSREAAPELFRGAVGSAGLLGVFTRLRIQLKGVPCGWLEVEPVSTPDLEAMFACFREREHEADYLVGWIDATARGRALGRGLVHAARRPSDPDPGEASASLDERYQDLPSRLLGVVPKDRMWMLMRPWTNRWGMRVVNTAKYHLGRIEERRGISRQSYAAFTFLLDYVPGWKRAYGPRGLLQWQCFVPRAGALPLFRRILERCQDRGRPPLLAVFKQHRPDDYLLTHAVDGFSLALDFPARWRIDLAGLLAELEAMVVTEGGRFYFAKDSTMSTGLPGRYLPPGNLERFAELRRRCDPERVLQSLLSKRVFGEDWPG